MFPHVFGLKVVMKTLARGTVDFFDLVSEHPSEQVDAMDALVHERAAILLPCSSPGRLLVIGFATVPADIDRTMGDSPETTPV